MGRVDGNEEHLEEGVTLERADTFREYSTVVTFVL